MYFVLYGRVEWPPPDRMQMSLKLKLCADNSAFSM